MIEVKCEHCGERFGVMNEYVWAKCPLCGQKVVCTAIRGGERNGN
jgi:DNA-directed RNA polymerase subunit RPC12/RpoP